MSFIDDLGLNPVSFADCMVAVRDKLLDYGVVEELARIIPLARQETPKLVGERDIILRAGAEQVDPAVLGGGRNTTFARRTLEVICRSRNALDRAGSDAVWMLGDPDGHIRYEDQVIDALQIHFPIAENLKPLFREPMRYMGVSQPRKDVQAGSEKWGESVLQFEIKYLRKLDLTRQ